ncbi:MAG: hypothetical protein ABH889_02680 [Candidatus Portnoybacteria bacterium]
MQYAWLIWSLILVGIWLAVYLSLNSKEKKKEMLVVSLWTSLLGFTSGQLKRNCTNNCSA